MEQNLLYGHWLYSNRYKYPMYIDESNIDDFSSLYNHIVQLKPKTTFQQRFQMATENLFGIDEVLGYGINHV